MGQEVRHSFILYSALCSGSQKAAFQVSARLCSHLEAYLWKNPLPSSLRLLTEFIFLQLYDIGPHFLWLLTGGCPEVPEAARRSLPRGLPPHGRLLHQTPKRNACFRKGSGPLWRIFTWFSQAHPGYSTFIKWKSRCPLSALTAFSTTFLLACSIPGMCSVLETCSVYPASVPLLLILPLPALSQESTWLLPSYQVLPEMPPAFLGYHVCCVCYFLILPRPPLI